MKKKIHPLYAPPPKKNNNNNNNNQTSKKKPKPKQNKKQKTKKPTNKQQSVYVSMVNSGEGPEEGVLKCKEMKKKIKKRTKKARQEWIGDQSRDTEDSLSKNDSKTANQTAYHLTCTKPSKTSTIEDQNGTNLKELQEITGRWTEYFSDIYSHKVGDTNVSNVPAIDSIRLRTQSTNQRIGKP